MAKYKIVKNGSQVGPDRISASNIFDSNNISLQNRLDNVGKVVARYNTGTLVATINGVEVRVPQEAMSVTITGTKFYNTLDTLIDSSDAFTEGQIVETKGFYALNDGGGSRFIIIASNKQLDTDDATLIKLQNGLYAQLMEPADGVINFRQFGAKSYEQDTGCDCREYLLKYLNFLNRTGRTYKLFIPGGVWQCSQTTLSREEGFYIYGENSESSLMPGKTLIVPMAGSSQSYVWQISGSHINIGKLQFTAKQEGFGYAKQMGISSASWGYSDATCTKMLYINNVQNSYFESLYFTFSQCCIDIANTQNTYFGFLNIRSSGGKYGNIRSVIVIGDNVEGVYFDYLNAEGIRGNVFYGYGTDVNAPTQFILNNLQMEATHPNSGTDPGYDHSISHWFIFNGKLGSQSRPCILSNVSISNLSSYYYADNTTYKTMGIFGHETNVPMGFIVGNAFALANESGPWFIYDTAKGASFTFNQPVSEKSSVFYLRDADMPLINTFNKKPNIIQAARCGERVSYKNGALSAHELVGSNNNNEYYTLHTLGNQGISFRFYHSEGEPTTINAVVEKYVNDQWTSAGTFTINCSNSIGWQIATIPNLNINIPLKIRIKGLPKYIDYFTNYEVV